MGEIFRASAEYLVPANDLSDSPTLTSVLMQQTCRAGFERAGFSLVRLGPDWGSRRLRQLMLDILDELCRQCEAESGRPLSALSMSRFDQQSTTKPHRDGGPAESLLLLGYEPTPVESQLSMADYSLCARSMGLSPSEFLHRHNPMFPSETDLLTDYTTRIRAFDPGQFQILLVNNSCADYDEDAGHWQGVLHQATVAHPRTDAVRVVNSIQLVRGTAPDLAPVTPNERTLFLNDDALGRHYGRSG